MAYYKVVFKEVVGTIPKDYMVETKCWLKIEQLVEQLFC
jgi:hypothetical protein